VDTYISDSISPVDWASSAAPGASIAYHFGHLALEVGAITTTPASSPALPPLRSRIRLPFQRSRAAR
jgi:hypothetical protein